MKCKKRFIFICLIICLFSIASVCASDANDISLASEDAGQMELSIDNEIIDDNLKANEETTQLQSNYDGTLSVENELDILNENVGTYSDLKNEIGNGGNINLTKDYYSYNYIDWDATTIKITASGVIDGKGAVIDMAESTIRAFDVSASGVTIKNLTIKNVYYRGTGGAIYFSQYGTVTNCNFTGNKATGDYAIYMDSGSVENCNFVNNAAGVCFRSNGNVSNCNFTDNSAFGRGGAIIFEGEGTVTKCNFINNIATNGYAGAVCFFKNGEVINCNFVNNSASDDGGAVWIVSGNVENCNFVNNSAVMGGGAVSFDNSGTVTNCNFINNAATNGCAGAVYFSRGGEMTNCNFVNNSASGSGGAVVLSEGNVSNCNFTDNSASGDYSFGGAVRLSNGNVSNCNFTDNSASGDQSSGGAIYMDSGSVENCNFVNNTATGDYSSGGAIEFDKTGIVTNCNFVNNAAIGDYIYGGAIRFIGDGTVTNCNFTGNKANGDYSSGGAGYFLACYGGAIYMDSGSVANCNFVNNAATGDYGRCGGVYFISNGNVSNCNFTDNSASGRAGAIIFEGEGTVTNCNFTGNNASAGSAIYCLNYGRTLTISNSSFLNNRANAEALEVTKNENNITIIFKGKNNLLNAIYCGNAVVTFTNVTYWGANGIINTGSSTIQPSRLNMEAGQNITVRVFFNDTLVLDEVMVTDEKGMIVLNISAGETYYISARHDTDSYYTEAEKTFPTLNVNVTSQISNNKTVNITAKSNIPYELTEGKLLFLVPDSDPIVATYGGDGIWWALHTFGNYGEFEVGASVVVVDNVVVNNATITVNKIDSTLTLNNSVIFDYGGSGYTIVSYSNALGINASVINQPKAIVNVDGNTITVSGLDAGNYTLSVTTITDENHNSVTKTASISVNKIDSTLTVNDVVLDYGTSTNVTVKTEGATGITAKINDTEAVVENNTIAIPVLDAGIYTLTVTAIADSNHNSVTGNVTITVNKLKTELAANAISTIYNINKNLIITLKDANGKALDGFKVTVNLNGAKTYTTDKNGQVKINIAKLVPKTYTAIITFAENTNYIKSTADVKVTVKKATPKLIALKKTFKRTIKVKNYVVALKTNQNKVMKNTWVTLTVNKKTFKVKTNAKGQAIFKITNLNKKGNFIATVKYVGNAYYDSKLVKQWILVR